MDKIGDLPQDDPIARGCFPDDRPKESEVHKLAKSMMLRDLRGHLDDWEKGRYTYLDMNEVWLNISNIFKNWRHYNDAALIKPPPEQLPLFPEDDSSVQVNF